MAEDYYTTLGVARDASDAEIKKAYHRLAAKYHPDANPGDRKAKEKFQQIQQAYEVLKDPATRKKYDQFGANYEAAGGGGPWQYTSTGGGPDFDQFDFSSIFGGGGGFEGFGDAFRQFREGAGPGAGPRRGRRTSHRGGDIRHDLEVAFRTAVEGGEVRLSIRRAEGPPETLTVKIPAGVKDGQTIRLRGQGEPGGGIPGDLLLVVHIGSHPFYTRRDLDLIVRVPVTIAEAAQGAKVDVPTPAGTITVKIPPGTSSGKRLRIKGQGVKTAKGEKGDLLVEVQIALPASLDAESLELIRRLDERNPSQPRTDLAW